MALPSGVYIIENVHNRNWAILTNDNDGDDVLSGTDADTNSGHKWEVRKLHNGTYLLRNQQFRNHASYKITDDIGDRSSVLSIRTGDPKRWHINNSNGFYWISDLDGSRCWTLRYNHPETPITLEKYTHSNYQHWKILPESEVYSQASDSGAIPRKSQPGLRKCPPPTPVFTGRRDILLKMHKYFSGDIGKRHIFILIGLGGVGKSQLSLKFIEECQVDTNPSRFSDVIFVDATSVGTINDDLRNIALAKGMGDSSEAALQWLSRRKDEWLLFFDNADDTRLNLHNYFPRSSNGNIMVTTRNNEARIHAPQSTLTISSLTPDDAKDLLLKIAGVRERTKETISLAKAIVKEMGHLALAIIQAGSYISKSGCSLLHYFEMYQERRLGLLEEYRDSVQKIDDYEWTVYTTWIVSFEKLSTQAATFLNICAFLHHDGISVEMFQKASSNITTRILGSHQVSEGLGIAIEFLTSFRSGEDQWDLHKFLTVMTEIRSYSLIDFDKRNEMYSIHPLVHAWTRDTVTDPATIHECSQYILSMSIDGEHGLKDIAYRLTLLPHVDASLRGGTVNDADVVKWLWRPYREGGRWNESEKLQALAVELNKQVLGGDHPGTLASLADLAFTYRNQGRFVDAEEILVRVTETRKRVLGERHPDTLSSMANLAVTYSSRGRSKDARELKVHVMEMRRRILGEEHLDTLWSMADLAVVYSSEGRLIESEELLVRVTEMRQRVLGGDHPDTLWSMASLAVTYSKQGRLIDSEKLLVRVTEMRKRVFGEEHPQTLWSMASLAVTYSKQGRLMHSEELQMRVTETRKRVLGEEHPDTLWSMASLGVTYLKQGRSKDAEELLMMVTEVRTRVIGEEHPNTLESMHYLALAQKALGRTKDAEKLLVRVVELSKGVLGEDHPNTQHRVADLASTIDKKKRPFRWMGWLWPGRKGRKL